MKKVLFLVVIVLITMLSVANAAGFSDVSRDHWANNAINKMVENGVVLGYPDGSFKPDNLVTRAEFAKIVVNALDLDLSQANSEQIFEDVDSSHWAFPYVNVASKFLTGYKENGNLVFKPDRVSVREDVAVAIVIASEMNKLPYDLDSLKVFSDENSISSNLKKYVAIAYENGLINGYDDGTFRPKASLTRAQVCQLMVNLLDKTQKVAVSDALGEYDIKIEGTDFIFNKQDFTIDLGADWRNCNTLWYKAGQRHLSYEDAVSNGYKKYQNESEKVARSYGDDYYAWYDLNLNLIKEGKAYCDIRNTSKGISGCYVPIPFMFEAKNGNEVIHNYSNLFVKSKAAITFKATTLNDFDKAHCELYYYGQDGSRKTINTSDIDTENFAIILGDFSSYEEQHLSIKVYDEFGNYQNYSYTFIDSRLKDLNVEYYSLISNGVEKSNGKQIIKVAGSDSKIISLVVPSKVILSDRMLDGSIYRIGKPVFVCVCTNSKGEVEQVIDFNDDGYGNRSQYTMNLHAHRVYLGHDQFNEYVYYSSDLDDDNMGNTNGAKKWLCEPTKDGFRTLGRSYSLSNPNTIAFVVPSNNDFHKVDYFFIGNYPNTNPIQISATTTTTTSSDITAKMTKVPDGQIAKFCKKLKKGDRFNLTLKNQEAYGEYWSDGSVIDIHADEMTSEFLLDTLEDSWITLYGVELWSKDLGFEMETISNGDELLLTYKLKNKTYYAIAKVENGHADTGVVNNFIFFVINNDKTIKLTKWKEITTGQTKKLISKMKSGKIYTITGHDAVFDVCQSFSKAKEVAISAYVTTMDGNNVKKELKDFIKFSEDPSDGYLEDYNIVRLAAHIFGFEVIDNFSFYIDEDRDNSVPVNPILKYGTAYKIIKVDRVKDVEGNSIYTINADELGEFISYVILNNKDITLKINK